MAYHSEFPTKDTIITNVEMDGAAKTGSNSGKSEILELYVLTSSLGNRGKSRALLYFDLSYISGSTVDGTIPTSSVQFKLRLKNSNHYQTNPSSFILSVNPLSRSWDEGNGLSMYDEELKDDGFANWNNATSVVNWTVSGSDFLTSYEITQSFDGGFEDLEMDVSPIVYAWLTGGLANNGFVVKYSDAHETGSIDFFVKKFYSRHAHVHERRPRLEVLWEDVIQDDRANFKYKQSGSLYYYRYFDGAPQNAGTLFVDIINSSSAVVQTLTASNPETGIYYISGAFVLHTSSTIYFRDVWFNSSEQVFTGSFKPEFSTGSGFYNYNDLDVLLPNLKPEYNNLQKFIVNVFGKNRDYRPAIRQSGSTEPTPLLFKEAYYELLNAETEEVVVPFSTGSNKFSKISYDKNGNYFEFSTRGLIPQSLYKIKILVKYNGQDLIFDKNWVFKVL